MGIRAVPSQPSPEPKATCPTCQRPIVLLKAATCLYCGNAIPGALSLVPKPDLPPELMFALEPKAGDPLTRRRRFVRAFLAIGTCVLLISLFIGSCMKS